MAHDNTSEDIRICANCHHANTSYAVRCIRCGARLIAPDTLPMSPDEIAQDKLVTMRHEMKTIQHGRLYDDALFLYALDHAQSMIVVDKHTLILGREDPGTKPTPGDLSRFNAYAMGVSRKHAQITYQDGKYILEDLGSANGTWVNGQRLPPHEPYPLKNEDLIWLSKLVLMVCLAS